MAKKLDFDQEQSKKQFEKSNREVKRAVTEIDNHITYLQKYADDVENIEIRALATSIRESLNSIEGLLLDIKSKLQ